MPRRRISGFRKDLRSGLRSLNSAMVGQLGDHRARGIDLVAQRGPDDGALGQVDVDARAEADEAEALSPRQHVAAIDIAEDAPGNEAGDLYANHVRAAAGAKPDRKS